MRIMLVVGGAFLALGTFMPWITITAPLAGDVSRSGVDLVDIDAIIMVVAGVGAGLVGFANHRRLGARALVVLLGLAGGGLAAFHINQMNQRVQLVNADTPGLASVGFGLYVCALGAGLVILGPFMAKR